MALARPIFKEGSIFGPPTSEANARNFKIDPNSLDIDVPRGSSPRR